jgi:hypothetical protein
MCRTLVDGKRKATLRGCSVERTQGAWPHVASSTHMPTSTDWCVICGWASELARGPRTAEHEGAPKTIVTCITSPIGRGSPKHIGWFHNTGVASSHEQHGASYVGRVICDLFEDDLYSDKDILSHAP